MSIPAGVPTFLRFRHLLRLLQVDPLNEQEVRYVRGLLDRKAIPFRQLSPRADRLMYPGEVQEWAEMTGTRLDWEGLLAEEME